MVPGEILEDILAYLSRDALDYCETICLKWRNVIETSKRLTQRRVVNLKTSYHDYYEYYGDEPIQYFIMELESLTTGKTIYLQDDPTYQFNFPHPEAFKNIIIDEVVENALYVNSQRWTKIFDLAGGRILVKRVDMIWDKELLQEDLIFKRINDFVTKYIDAEILTVIISPLNNFFFNKESWKNLDFEKKTLVNILYRSHLSFSYFPIGNFKEFISGRYLEHSRLNELRISFHNINRHDIFSSISEAFCNNDEPQKFFKTIEFLERNDLFLEKLDEIINQFGFVRDQLDPNKYRLPHPKMKWALETTQSNDEYLKFQSIEL